MTKILVAFISAAVLMCICNFALITISPQFLEAPWVTVRGVFNMLIFVYTVVRLLVAFNSEVPSGISS